MTRLLISTAIAGLLALSVPALAQDRGGDHRDDHNRAAPAAAPAQAAKPAPAQAARPAIGGRAGHGFTGAQNAPAAPPADRRAQEDHRPGAGAQNAPAAQPASRNAMRDQGPNNAMRGPGPSNSMRGPSNANRGSNNNFASFQRNFNAPRRFHAPTYRRPTGWYSHRWTYGETLPSLFWAPDFWLNDYVDFGLEPPPPGTVWVRDGGDALLIVRGTGEIIQVEYSVFY